MKIIHGFDEFAKCYEQGIVIFFSSRCDCKGCQFCDKTVYWCQMSAMQDWFIIGTKNKMFDNVLELDFLYTRIY